MQGHQEIGRLFYATSQKGENQSLLERLIMSLHWTFDLGNNFDHVGLRLINPTKAMATPSLSNQMDEMVRELITPTQILVEEMAISSKFDNEKRDDEL